jgi:putative transposase
MLGRSSGSRSLCVGHLRPRGMAWCASTGGISGEMIRDLMLESVERRFGAAGLPHPIQWLSDNGSCYRAHETIDFATRLGLVSCFTPV